MQFAQPEWFWLFALVPLVAGWAWRREFRTRKGMRFSDVASARSAPKSLWARLREMPAVLRVGAVSLGILALARPQERDAIRERYAEGVDIVLVLDASPSMRAEDFSPNRFEAARDVAAEFIESRISDRVGLVVFAEKAYTQTPLTLDYDFLLRMLHEIEVGAIGDGTAIGTAIAMGVNRLKDSAAESKVLILLTDGRNNRGEIDPLTASDVAQTMDVRIYSIGVGTHGEAPFPFDDPLGGQRRQMLAVEIDEDMLASVAEKTGGRYFRAANKEALQNIYAEIGELEKTEIAERFYTDYTERYALFLWPAFGLLLLEFLLSSTRLRRAP